MNFQQFIKVLWSRRSIVLSVFMATVLTTLIISLLLPKKYIAKVSIMVNQQSIDQVTGLTLPVQMMPGYMATQVDVIGSHTVARKVVDKLKISDQPQLQKEFAKTQNIGDINDWMADLLLKDLEIKPSRESSLIQINFTSIDPQLAVLIANTFAEAYIQTSIELHAQPAKLMADWFDMQMIALRDRLEQAQSALSIYQQQKGVVAIDDRLDIENTRLADLSKQLVDNQNRTHELQSRQDLLSTLDQTGSYESLQEVLNSPLIQSLKAEAARAEASFAKQTKQLDINHPQYKQMEAEIASLRQKIQSEVHKVLNSIAGELVSSKQRDEILTQALDEQKSKVLELKKQHDAIRLFGREVENAQKAYDLAMQRSIQTRMESEVSQASLSILNPAVLPQKPAKPKLLLNMILSVFLGGLLGVGSALLSEFSDRRVRSAFDVTESLGLPVFALLAPEISKQKISKSFI